MDGLAERFIQNPLLRPADVKASMPGLKVACLLNPGVFQFNDKTFLIVRVAERPEQSEGKISFPIINAAGKTVIKEIALDDADLIASDARVIRYRGVDWLTTLSHLRLFSSDDGIHFSEDPDYPPIFGKPGLESFGIEDCRVAKIENTYWLTYTAVSENGVGVGMQATEDWKHFTRHGMILPPHNKDCALFPEKINGKFYALHRPGTIDNKNFIWIASSPDAVHWGGHKCIVKTREDLWDNARVGAGASPIKTPQGWLAIYHGANHEHRYCLGAFLMDPDDPAKVIARTAGPIMEPQEPYELEGFFGHVVFTNGHIVDGDTITIYYGAADELVCGARFSISKILNALIFI